MKKVGCICLFLLLSFQLLLSQNNYDDAGFQLTVIPPIGTQGGFSSQYTNKYSLNILLGSSHNEKKFTFGFIANTIKNNAKGFQFAGVLNKIGNRSNGFQMAGVANLVRSDGKGLLLSGLLNNAGSYRGAQITGGLNLTKQMDGVQVGGLFNKSDYYVDGGQITAGINITPVIQGIQMAGLVNYSKEISGAQMAGLFNYADYVDGAQLSLFANRAKRVKKFQAAFFLNIAEECEYPLAMFNIIKNGEIGVGVTINEVGSTVFSIRSGSKKLYGIVGIGHNHRSKVSDQTLVIELGAGYNIIYSPVFRVKTELKGNYFSALSKTDTGQATFSVLPAFRLGSKFEVFFGPTLNYLGCTNRNNIKLFPNYSIVFWEKLNYRMQQIYIGFSAGCQYVF
ncbi:MAG: hypothetical protein LIO93_01385 [Bacteroidales bacterium]|nr:hypothetical protein [Bacteroidales bacterium]